MHTVRVPYILFTVLAILACSTAAPGAGPSVDFNRDVRPILSNNCFRCHGPDAGKRKAGLRLDTRDGALAALSDSGDKRAVVPGRPEESALIRRVTEADPDERMPPASSGKKLLADEIATLTRWIREGASYAEHWSYVKPIRPPLPEIRDRSWPRNEVDHFVLSQLESQGLSPGPEAARHALARRVSLTLTGLPPSVEEADRFASDPEPQAYERFVERLLAKKTFGEHWARMWLDLARYADSAGYADDPPRTIWAFRDYVIRSFNANKPFDQFTVEQIAGDLLPDPSEEQRIATAFHRNTLTNNEGGTNDEEFRNVAIVDRVNTTMAVWMGTTINCAQCHNHKYDPISQEEFFRLFAVFNNTEDADRRDEAPTLALYTDEQREKQKLWREEITALERKLATPTPELLAAAKRWEERLAAAPRWETLGVGAAPSRMAMTARSGAALSRLDDGSVLVERIADAPAGAVSTDVYTVELELGSALEIAALRLEALPHDSLGSGGPGHGGNFVVSRVALSVTPPENERARGRFIRVEIPGSGKILSLAEVQVFAGAENIARGGTARQSSTAFDGPARLAIDGNTDGSYREAASTTHTARSNDPWWELDLGGERALDRIAIWNRTDNGLHTRLANFRLAVLDAKRETVWETTVARPPNPRAEYSPDGARDVRFVAAHADYEQSGFEASRVIDNKAPEKQGWAVGGQTGKAHELTLVPDRMVSIAAGSTVAVRIEQSYERHTLGRFRLLVTGDGQIVERSGVPRRILDILDRADEERTDQERAEITRHYIAEVAPALASERQLLATRRKQLAGMKPAATVPIQRELPEDRRRRTRIQRRGNYLELGDEVAEGIPAVFRTRALARALTARTGERETRIDRMTVARWLVDDENPLTPRVIANRLWEHVFGVGLVRTSEEFGSQGELPSHPELLDWLASELVRRRWNIKSFLELLVTSATYRQSSRVTPELLERDPDNRQLARGPRFRMSAEMIRDQALFSAGLLSSKMFGPPVRPPQPRLGLSAAFGSGVDWKTSDGEDRYRRGIYTTWRRSSPYPSMATFDAPNREVCTVRRERTNTPLQALVTLNDPVYVEAAQSLARRVLEGGGDEPTKATRAFRLVLIRAPGDAETERLVRLQAAARERFERDGEAARRMATDPIGAAPAGVAIDELAAWTVVGNVLLNLDETLMPR